MSGGVEWWVWIAAPHRGQSVHESVFLLVGINSVNCRPPRRPPSSTRRPKIMLAHPAQRTAARFLGGYVAPPPWKLRARLEDELQVILPLRLSSKASPNALAASIAAVLQERERRVRLAGKDAVTRTAMRRAQEATKGVLRFGDDDPDDADPLLLLPSVGGGTKKGKRRRRRRRRRRAAGAPGGPRPDSAADAADRPPRCRPRTSRWASRRCSTRRRTGPTPTPRRRRRSAGSPPRRRTARAGGRGARSC